MLTSLQISLIIGASGFLGVAFALLQVLITAKVKLEPKEGEEGHLLERGLSPRLLERLRAYGGFIADGASAFLVREYTIIVLFMVLFTGVIVLVLGYMHNWSSALYTSIAFVVGATTSLAAGYIGMKIAVFANTRTAICAQDSLGSAFRVAFRAGAVMGFSLVSLGLLMLYSLICLFKLHYKKAYVDADETALMYEALAGFGLGGSSIALFGRVGGGIFTKAADVGADLCGKLELDIPEDDPRNPAVIADNVGDNVGDIAGMGADLFGSFAESTCAALVIAAQSPDLHKDYVAMSFPLLVVCSGIVVCIVTSYFATHVMRSATDEPNKVEGTLKAQLLISTLLMTPCVFAISWYLLPKTFVVSDHHVRNWYICICVCGGLWAGLIIGYVTEYYTSYRYSPVRHVANSCQFGGAATNIIAGLALGYRSVVIPVVALAGAIWSSFTLAGMFGIACAAVGILSTMAIGLTIDAYGPICDNAGGLAEMTQMDEHVRHRTDVLDAAGNTTAAIGKGFAIGSAALVSLALFGAFVTTSQLEDVDILHPFQFTGLLLGAMLPYWFSAMTMSAVGTAAQEMVQEVHSFMEKNPHVLQTDLFADVRDAREEEQRRKTLASLQEAQTRCISVSTTAALRQMIQPGLLVIGTPLIVGMFLGKETLAGVLAGALVSGVQMAVSASNTGGAWDNAKKWVEGNGIPGHGKGSEVHKAAVVGDTVGDPMKDTSGPSLNILIKLMAIVSLVFGPAFRTDGLLIKWLK